MFKVLTSAGVFLASLSVAALACMEPPELTHKREMALLDDGLKTTKHSAADIANAKKLQKRADALYRAGKLAPAVEARHAALVKIGYKLEESLPGPTARGVAPPVAAMTQPKSKDAPVIAATGGCGNADHWIAPTE